MTGSRTAPDPAARSSRLIALALGIPILLVLAVLFAMPFMAGNETTLQVDGHVPAEPGTEQGGVHFSGTVHQWAVSGSLAIDADREARLSFRLRGPDGSPPRQAMQVPIVFTMPGHDMEMTVTARQTGPDSFAARSTLPMAGAWQMRMTFSDVDGVLSFDTRG
ncbi:FixH family protein [Halomonas sp. ANAO-440]|uniref:FixH family protein n=1 Tax=Halomonas sp. ANAO-440 TaxID=2861360 RepID=UPI001CAA5CB5|nr:FixH family protein [Halomonas sp. ANAO-440]MBZ0329306.1 FixH family protein [Halomonas sp. ANAO-440]